MTRSLIIPMAVALCFIAHGPCFAANDNKPGGAPHTLSVMPVSAAAGTLLQNTATTLAEPHVPLPQMLALPHGFSPRFVHRHHRSRWHHRYRVVTPALRVARANAAARSEPVEDQYQNAIQIYPYADGTLYKLYAAVGRISDIALEPGETLIDKAAGDTVRWVVGDTSSGAGRTLATHILVKPTAANLRTNLIITTNRRTYHLELASTRETYMASLSWHYPQSSLPERGANRLPTSLDASEAKPDRNLGALNFNYRLDGPKVSWKPLRVFDDGVHVYLQFAETLGARETAPLFVMGSEGAELVNYRQQGNSYIVDRLFDKAELRLGSGKQQVVHIVRLDAHHAETQAAFAGGVR